MKDEILEEISDSFIHSESALEEVMDPKSAKKVASECIQKVKKKMEKISIAPGEHGKFKNWGDDIFLEVNISKSSVLVCN